MKRRIFTFCFTAVSALLLSFNIYATEFRLGITPCEITIGDMYIAKSEKDLNSMIRMDQAQDFDAGAKLVLENRIRIVPKGQIFYLMDMGSTPLVGKIRLKGETEEYYMLLRFQNGIVFQYK